MRQSSLVALLLSATLLSAAAQAQAVGRMGLLPTAGGVSDAPPPPPSGRTATVAGAILVGIGGSMLVGGAVAWGLAGKEPIGSAMGISLTALGGAVFTPGAILLPVGLVRKHHYRQWQGQRATWSPQLSASSSSLQLGLGVHF